jgi:hypothetical protein
MEIGSHSFFFFSFLKLLFYFRFYIWFSNKEELEEKKFDLQETFSSLLVCRMKERRKKEQNQIYFIIFYFIIVFAFVLEHFGN